PGLPSRNITKNSRGNWIFGLLHSIRSPTAPSNRKLLVVWRLIRTQTCWTTLPQPVLCLSAFQWHAKMMSSQLEKDTNEVQYIMSGVDSVVDLEGRRLTCGSSF
uniref:Polyprotein n=1 Tax=Mesocestoides corti TaxID=53468 RepID=A0A5K3FAA4_MESCO